MGIGEIRDALSVRYNVFYTMEPYDKSCNRSFAVKQPVDIKSTFFFTQEEHEMRCHAA